MRKFNRFTCQPPMPLGKNRTFITGCKAHWAIAKQGAVEGTVLLKNNGALPLAPGAKICLFGSGSAEFVLGGGGSGGVNTDRKITLVDGLQTAAARSRAGEWWWWPWPSDSPGGHHCQCSQLGRTHQIWVPGGHRCLLA